MGQASCAPGRDRPVPLQSEEGTPCIVQGTRTYQEQILVPTVIRVLRGGSTAENQPTGHFWGDRCTARSGPLSPLGPEQVDKDGAKLLALLDAGGYYPHPSTLAGTTLIPQPGGYYPHPSTLAGTTLIPQP